MNPRCMNGKHFARHCRVVRGNACLAAKWLLKLRSQRADNLNKAQTGPANTQTNGAFRRP
jgi:hypothetical protein